MGDTPTDQEKSPDGATRAIRTTNDKLSIQVPRWAFVSVLAAVSALAGGNIGYLNGRSAQQPTAVAVPVPASNPSNGAQNFDNCNIGERYADLLVKYGQLQSELDSLKRAQDALREAQANAVSQKLQQEVAQAKQQAMNAAYLCKSQAREAKEREAEAVASRSAALDIALTILRGQGSSGVGAPTREVSAAKLDAIDVLLEKLNRDPGSVTKEELKSGFESGGLTKAKVLQP